ncbi:MAG: dTDP-4-dehydrorhamnose 3,5-epimerase [Gammaproteobacteria bacterium]|nr:dTDP-4-dehydrorhamnose 3,5-epimerase [Gammaproteobacteria bacterium]
MRCHETPLAGVMVVETDIRQDPRGGFARFYCGRELKPVLEKRNVVQINYSRSVEIGTVRGMHFQLTPYAEMKMIRCIKGKVWDVAVDLRKGSSTFLKWHAQELSKENNKMMIVPEGVAHGFQTLEAESELLYLHTQYYEPDYEGGIRYDDPMLNISWPLKAEGLSERDLSFPRITDDFSGVELFSEIKR